MKKNLWNDKLERVMSDENKFLETMNKCGFCGVKMSDEDYEKLEGVCRKCLKD